MSSTRVENQSFWFLGHCLLDWVIIAIEKSFKYVHQHSSEQLPDYDKWGGWNPPANKGVAEAAKVGRVATRLPTE